jgi:ABC-type Na+ efflux pump permease subunit
MEALRQWIETNRNEVKLTINVILGVVILLALGWVVGKAVWAFKGGKASEGLKWLGYGALIVLVGLLGIMGLHAFISQIAPTSSIPGMNQGGINY